MRADGMMRDMSEFVRLEVADGVGTIRLDRPKMNAISLQVQDELARRRRRGEPRATTSRRSSCTAARRSSRPATTSRRWPTSSYADMVELGASVQSAVTAVARIPKPVVAAITGYALGGGCELALAADVRFAADGRGARPARDPARDHPRRRRHPAADPAGRASSKAKDLIFTGRFVKADEALAIGLVDRVVPRSGQVYDEAVAWARQFAGAASYALRAAKEAIDRGIETDLETGLEIERAQFAGLFATADRETGMRSFIENGPGKAAVRGQVSDERRGREVDWPRRRAPPASRGLRDDQAAPGSRPAGLAGVPGRGAVPGGRGAAHRAGRQPRQRAGEVRPRRRRRASTSGSSRSTTGS